MCAVQFKEMGLWEGVEVVNHEMRYQCKRDSDVHVGHENWARLAVDNSFHIASVHSLVTRQLSVGHLTYSNQDLLMVSQTLFCVNVNYSSKVGYSAETFCILLKRLCIWLCV